MLSGRRKTALPTRKRRSAGGVRSSQGDEHVGEQEGVKERLQSAFGPDVPIASERKKRQVVPLVTMDAAVGVSFAHADDEQLRRLAVVQVRDKLDLLDPRLGIMSDSQYVLCTRECVSMECLEQGARHPEEAARCENPVLTVREARIRVCPTCELPASQCPGHVGIIEMPVPVLDPSPDAAAMLCVALGHLCVADFATREAQRVRGCERLCELPDSPMCRAVRALPGGPEHKLRELKARCKQRKRRECAHCGAPCPVDKVRWDERRCLFLVRFPGFEGLQELSAPQLEPVLRRCEERCGEELRALGLATPLHHLLHRVAVVLPPVMLRPTIQGGSVRRAVNESFQGRSGKGRPSVSSRGQYRDSRSARAEAGQGSSVGMDSTQVRSQHRIKEENMRPVQVMHSIYSLYARLAETCASERVALGAARAAGRDTCDEEREASRACFQLLHRIRGAKSRGGGGGGAGRRSRPAEEPDEEESEEEEEEEAEVEDEDEVTGHGRKGRRRGGPPARRAGNGKLRVSFQGMGGKQHPQQQRTEGPAAQNLESFAGGKEGWIREMLAGKRIFDGNRWVVVCDNDSVAPDEVGIPFPQNLLLEVEEEVCADTVERARHLARSRAVRKVSWEEADSSGELHSMCVSLEEGNTYEQMEAAVSPGCMLTRMLMDGDRVVLCRQPTLTFLGQQGFKVRILQTADLPVSLGFEARRLLCPEAVPELEERGLFGFVMGPLRINDVVTSPFAGDFDGDEFLVVLLAVLAASLEAAVCNPVEGNLLCPMRGTNTMGLIQDGLYVLCRLSHPQASLALSDAWQAACELRDDGCSVSADRSCRILSDAASPEGRVSGRDLLRCVLPQGLLCPGVVEGGRIVYAGGELTSVHLGVGGTPDRNLVACAARQLPQREAMRFLENLKRLSVACARAGLCSLTFGMPDVLPGGTLCSWERSEGLQYRRALREQQRLLDETTAVALAREHAQRALWQQARADLAREHPQEEKEEVGAGEDRSRDVVSFHQLRQGAHRQWTATLGLHQGGRTAAVLARALAGERFPGVRDTFVTHRSLRRLVDEVVHSMVRARWQSGGSLGPLLHAEDADGAAAVLCRSALAPAPPAVAAAPVAGREEWGVPRWQQQHRQAPPHHAQRRGVLDPQQVLELSDEALADLLRQERERLRRPFRHMAAGASDRERSLRRCALTLGGLTAEQQHLLRRPSPTALRLVEAAANRAVEALAPAARSLFRWEGVEGPFGLPAESNVSLMVRLGTKGSATNVDWMTACMAQQLRQGGGFPLPAADGRPGPHAHHALALHRGADHGLVLRSLAQGLAQGEVAKHEESARMSMSNKSVADTGFHYRTMSAMVIALQVSLGLALVAPAARRRQVVALVVNETGLCVQRLVRAPVEEEPVFPAAACHPWYVAEVVRCWSTLDGHLRRHGTRVFPLPLDCRVVALRALEAVPQEPGGEPCASECLQALQLCVRENMRCGRCPLLEDGLAYLLSPHRLGALFGGGLVWGPRRMAHVCRLLDEELLRGWAPPFQREVELAGMCECANRSQNTLSSFHLCGVTEREGEAGGEGDVEILSLPSPASMHELMHAAPPAVPLVLFDAPAGEDTGPNSDFARRMTALFRGRRVRDVTEDAVELLPQLVDPLARWGLEEEERGPCLRVRMRPECSHPELAQLVVERLQERCAGAQLLIKKHADKGGEVAWRWVPGVPITLFAVFCGAAPAQGRQERVFLKEAPAAVGRTCLAECPTSSDFVRIGTSNTWGVLVEAGTEGWGGVGRRRDGAADAASGGGGAAQVEQTVAAVRFVLAQDPPVHQPGTLYTNNLRTCQLLFGLPHASWALRKMFLQVKAASPRDVPVAPEHLSMLRCAQACTGTIRPFYQTQVNDWLNSPLSRVMFSEPTHNVESAALARGHDPLRSAPACMFANKRIHGGADFAPAAGTVVDPFRGALGSLGADACDPEGLACAMRVDEAREALEARDAACACQTAASVQPEALPPGESEYDVDMTELMVAPRLMWGGSVLAAGMEGGGVQSPVYAPLSPVYVPPPSPEHSASSPRYSTSSPGCEPPGSCWGKGGALGRREYDPLDFTRAKHYAPLSPQYCPPPESADETMVVDE